VKRKLSKLFDGPLYEKAMMIVTVTDREFQNLISSQVYGYADAIRIEDIVDVSDVSAGDINIREERLRDAENMSIYRRHIETEVDATYRTIRDAIQNQKYRETECWITTLVYTFEGSELMRQKRGKLAKTLSREKCWSC
jgi:hypothetical protein